MRLKNEKGITGIYVCVFQLIKKPGLKTRTTKKSRSLTVYESSIDEVYQIVRAALAKKQERNNGDATGND